MRPLSFGRKRVSKFIWDYLENKANIVYMNLEKMHERRQVLHAEADNPTGSLSIDDVEDLYMVVKSFDPDIIVEVGTYIGVSTETMRMAAPDAQIYTCDQSNDFEVLPDDPFVFQYPKKSSLEMFTELAEQKLRADLVYLDGRLNQQDLEPLSKIITPNTVFVFDDFEGVEKGVTNALMLLNGNWMLVYPREGNKTAIMIPYSLVQFVPQEAA